MSRRLLTSLFGPVLLLGCASGPPLERAVTIRAGEPVRVSYEQPETGLRQTLQAGDEDDLRDVYSSRESDPFAKVISTEEMQVVLDALATLDYFEHALPEEQPGAVSVIRVRIGDREHAWSKTPAMSVAEIGRYHEAMTAFLNLWNGTEAFHASHGGEAVLEEAARMREINERNQRRLQEKARATRQEGR